MIQTDEQILENQQKHGPKRGGTTHSFLMSDVLAGWKGSRGGFSWVGKWAGWLEDCWGKWVIGRVNSPG